MNNRSRALVAELFEAYDACWSAGDIAGVAALWTTDDPVPVYLGDEYPAPLIGPSDMAAHWSRMAARVKSIAMTSVVREVGELGEAFARCIVASDWAIRTVDSSGVRQGTSWCTFLLVRWNEGYRIFHQWEITAYPMSDGF